MVSRSMTRCRVVLCTSTIGVSPVTVIVSSTRADAHLGVDLRGERPGQLDALRADTVLKPGSVKVTV